MLNNLYYPRKDKRHQQALLKKLAILLKEYEEDFFDSITRYIFKDFVAKETMLNNLYYPIKVKHHQRALLKKLAILLKEYEEDFFDSITR